AAKDGGAAIVEGNRRVLAARLADARFFWEQDLKVPLEEQAKKLDGIIFHDKLGTVADKVDRIEKLALWLVEQEIIRSPEDTPQAKTELYNQVKAAARYCKGDLVTGMVGEFPELQGIIGGYLAEMQGESKAIADAIRDHYKPVGQGDEVPTAPVTVAVALADKLDTVVAFYVVNEKPTGSKDPFALRRAAIGIAAILERNSLRLPLTMAIHTVAALLLGRLLGTADKARFDAAIRALDEAGFRFAQGSIAKLEEAALSDSLSQSGSIYDDVIVPTTASLLDFFADRLKVQQRDAGVRHDLIDAVFSLGGEDDLVRLLARVKALQAFVETGEGADLLTAYKRAANILKKEKWERTAASGRGDLAPEEKTLIAALDKAEPKASAAIEKEDFTAAMAALASLRAPIDDFFDHVTVNDPD